MKRVIEAFLQNSDYLVLPDEIDHIKVVRDVIFMHRDGPRCLSDTDETESGESGQEDNQVGTFLKTEH